jgi:hypothetical protein
MSGFTIEGGIQLEAGFTFSLGGAGPGSLSGNNNAGFSFTNITSELGALILTESGLELTIE